MRDFGKEQREETTHAAEFDCLCRRVGDPSTIAETRRRLESAERACAVALDTYSGSRELLAEQLEKWLHASRMRYREAEVDRRVVGW